MFLKYSKSLICFYYYFDIDSFFPDPFRFLYFCFHQTLICICVCLFLLYSLQKIQREDGMFVFLYFVLHIYTYLGYLHGHTELRQSTAATILSLEFVWTFPLYNSLSYITFFTPPNCIKTVQRYTVNGKNHIET